MFVVDPWVWRDVGFLSVISVGTQKSADSGGFQANEKDNGISHIKTLLITVAHESRNTYSLTNLVTR